MPALPRTLGFIGLGQMGSRMAKNLLKSGHRLVVHDAFPAAASQLGASSDALAVASSPAELMSMLAASDDASTGEGAMIVTMLPNSDHVRSVYLGEEGLLRAPQAQPWSKLGPNLTMIDCSTIDPAAARDVGEAVTKQLGTFADAPVSGGVGGAENAALTFMVGAASEVELDRCTPLLQLMGKSVVHCGPVGSGQAAKLCNNLVLAISMAGVAEGMLLGQKLGVDKKVLAGIFNTSTARCWSSDTYNPCPGVMEGVPASRDFEGGFASALMLKDLKLALAAAEAAQSGVPIGVKAHDIYAAVCDAGWEGKDFGSVYQYLEAGCPPSKEKSA